MKILIFTASTGGGHKVAAAALENAFHRIKGIYYIKDNKDMFDYIIENMRKENPHDFSVEVFEINKDISEYTNNFTVKTDIMSFMTFCQSCKRVYKK